METYDGKRPASLDVFLKLVGLTEEEFDAIAAQHVVDPHRYHPPGARGEPLPDQALWILE